ncbi:M3 family metallopeptidase [Chelatococcus reniformis]|uniref:Dipeptidyl carboxypeptidase II n=1 Tax=Chelatococcus reniformis TaxID=1494448 RepID=A0A916U140_9HYPH|nr:M3 family metallopeptidase [Chelatococcus reniformis]GGC56426.1 dipeptidyl carboxypeptidase II [Chelatococcus reniformis]
MPPFADIGAEHFGPAFQRGMEEHLAEVAAITAGPQAPDFDNTVAALERSGATLLRVANVFFNLTGAHTSPALQAIEREVAPLLARHRSAIFLNEALYGRVTELARRTDAPKLADEQARVLERYVLAFERAGAGLGADARARMAAIAERSAALGTQFGQNVLADEVSWTLVLDEHELAGLPSVVRAAAAQTATDRGLDGSYVVTLARSSIEPFLQFASRRDLRERAFKAWMARGQTGGETDNRAILAELVALRAEKAALLGYASFADFRLSDSMAKTPTAAMDLLTSVWTPARAQALREEAALQELITADGDNFTIAPWDWRYYAERRRKAAFDLDEGELKPYLQLDKVIAAAFYTATRLFGLTFTERFDLPVYHPDVRAFEVCDSDGRHIGVFLGDYFARTSKRSGAWMNAFRTQERLRGDVRPIVVNVMNFAKAASGEPALLSFDEAHTLFHEFGHALHGLLSDVTYPMIAGTNVARDFVEFPSQLYEHWLEQPEILARFATHYLSGEAMPQALLARLLATRTYGQGFATVEYVASALADLELHRRPLQEPFDADAFERELLAEIGMPDAMVMRHRLPHFLHVFSGDGYSAAYYSYLWSEVLDADGFAAFAESGDIFDPDVAARLRREVYGAGNRRAADEAYRAFRGRGADPAHLLVKRGLDGGASLAGAA